MELVTGGAGFIGSHLVDALVRMGKSVRVLDELVSRPGDDGARKHDRVAKFGRKVEFRRGDIRDPKVVKRAVQGVKRVYHLAHHTGARASLNHAAACLEVNVLGTQNVLEAMDAAQVRSLVLCSHAHVYGDSSHPSEESDPLEPVSPFGASMVAAEALAAAWQSHSSGSVSIVRPFTTYGPRMPPTSGVRLFLEAIDAGKDVHLFGQDSSRDYVFASDVVRVLVEARRYRSKKRPAVFNVATGHRTGITELLREMEVTTGKLARPVVMPTQPGDPQHMWGSPELTAATFGVRPSVPLAQGLQTTLDWLRRL